MKKLDRQNIFKFLVPIIIAALVVGAAVFVFTKKEDDSFKNIDQIESLYTALREDDKEKIAEISDYPPQLEYADVYLAPKKIKDNLGKDVEVVMEDVDFESYKGHLELFVNRLNENKIPHRNLEFEHKQSAYFTNLKHVPADSMLEKLYMYNSRFSTAPHQIIRLNVSAGRVEQLLGKELEIIHLGTLETKADKDWKDIKEFQVIELEENRVAAMYLLQDSFGYKQAAVVDVYDLSEGLKNYPVTNVLDYSTAEDTSEAIAKLRREVINGKGIFY